jgi:uncharacterized membrane protein HdeD (DUF308 family)
MKEIIQKVTDIVTIAFPAIIAIFGVLHISGAIQITEQVEQVLLIVLGALSAIASVVYNRVAKK